MRRIFTVWFERNHWFVDSSPNLGDAVAALGAPTGQERTITTGILRAVDRSTTVAIERFTSTVPSSIQMDASTNPGDNNGPLVDCTPELVGVNFAGTPPTVAENINFAVSAKMIRQIVPEIIDTGTFDHPYFVFRGITVSPMISRLNDIDETTEGVYVEQTVDGFPADVLLQGSTSIYRETGVPIVGDVIVAIDGSNIGDPDELRNHLFEETRPEERITLTILRDGDEHKITGTLVAKPVGLERIHIREPTM